MHQIQSSVYHQVVHLNCCVHTPNIFALILDLKNRLVSFIERETLTDYDREAEAALQRLTTGEVDVNRLTNLWAKAYSEVRAQSQTND